MKINSTLEFFLLSRIGGRILPANREAATKIKPGTIGAMASPLQLELCENVRIQLPVFIPMQQIQALLSEYFDGIGWQPNIGISTGGDCMGDLRPPETEGLMLPLALWAFYEGDKDTGKKVSILNVGLDPEVC